MTSENEEWEADLQDEIALEQDRHSYRLPLIVSFLCLF